MVPLPKGFELGKSLNPRNFFFFENKEVKFLCCSEKKKDGFLLVAQGFSVEVRRRSEV